MINKAIFIHVPKTAGMSIIEATKELNVKCIGHRKASDFTEKQLRESFVFSFVRNPYDRFISAFFYLKQGGINIKDKSIGDILPNDIQQCVDLIKSLDDSFMYKKRKLFHFQPQHQWHNAKIDFIGRYERLNDDFAYISTKIANKKIILPHMNESKKKYYTEYLTKNIIDSINGRFYKDFDKYHYLFL